MYVCRDVHEYVHLYIYMYMYMCIHEYTYIYIYSHIHTYKVGEETNLDARRHLSQEARPRRASGEEAAAVRKPRMLRRGKRSIQAISGEETAAVRKPRWLAPVLVHVQANRPEPA